MEAKSDELMDTSNSGVEWGAVEKRKSIISMDPWHFERNLAGRDAG